MKKFRFTLQSLLDIRTKEENSLKNELWTANAFLSQLENQYQQTKQKFENCQTKIRNNSINITTALQMKICHHRLQGLIKDMKTQYKDILIAKEECEKIIFKLTEVRKTIKMLQTLKQKKYEQYLKEVEAEQTRIMDDYLSSKVVSS